MNSRRTLLLMIVIGFLASYTWYRIEKRDGRRASESFTPADAPAINLEDVKVLAAVDGEYTKLVESVVPSVVSITSSRAVLQKMPLTIEDLVRGQQRAQWARSTSLGSGVIVSKEGHILTNNHVVADMTEIRVQLTDGRNVAAQLIGTDPSTDIAVLRIDEKNIQPLPLGDSDSLHVGQQVIAVGNPYGLEESVSRGIVSAKGRKTASDSGVEFIQHDAAVNQGNSGGPLLNIRGEIVGINSQIYSRTGGWQGISFAIPSNTAREIMEGILRRGRLMRPYLGVGMQMISPAIARNFGLPDTKGILVTQVAPDSPAAAAGLQPGDVVRSFKGQPITDVRQMSQAIAGAEVGEHVEVVVLRQGREVRIAAVLQERPPEVPQAP